VPGDGVAVRSYAGKVAAGAMRAALLIAALLGATACGAPRGAPEESAEAPGVPATVTGATTGPGVAETRLTWLSVTNWLMEVGDTRVLFDGYLTRIDRRLVEADGSSHGTATTDTAELRRLLEPALPDLRLDWILVGHGHWDHAWDVAAIARLTGARIAGARTVCLEAEALGVPPARCTAVEGGEVLRLGDDVRARVVRWHHSGDPATEEGRRLSAPLELRRAPVPDPATGGLRPGFLEDFPNGGGARAYLVTVGGAPAARTFFWSNTGSAAAWNTAVRADTAALRAAGVDLGNLVAAPPGPPSREALEAALRDEGITEVDAWIGFGGAAHVRQVAALLRPRALVPHHWDDFWTSMTQGPGRGYSAAAVQPFLDSAGIRLVIPEYYGTLRLEELGVGGEP
jgi:L-ascorbate metabolism protein UlaG (beta-lactamase superfamily)